MNKNIRIAKNLVRIAKMFLGDEDVYTRMDIAENLNTPIDVLIKLAENKNGNYIL